MIGGVFVTGTDTEVGKTGISAALLQLLGQGGQLSAGYKPVAAGTDADGRNDDVSALQAGSSLPLTSEEICPALFRTACAPHIAAQLEGRTIDPAELRIGAMHLAPLCDWLVVEGVGGFRVPLAPGWDSADLACEIRLPVLLVVGLRLGCISHALLTAEAIRARGLRLAGWVGNAIDPHFAHRDANIDTLREALAPAPCLGLVPWLPDASAAAIAPHLDEAALRTALTLNPAH